MARKHDPWTAEEHDLIRRFYPIVGGSWSGWAELFPNRMPSTNSICQQAHRLGVSCESQFRYAKGKKQAVERADAMLAEYLKEKSAKS